MVSWWSLLRFVHVLSAATWVGGQITLSALLLPLLRRRLPDELRASLSSTIGRRFGMYTMTVFLPVQVASGVGLAMENHVTFASLGHPGYGRTLLTKLIERGLAASPDVAAAESRVRKARAAVREQRANRLPSVSATGTAIVADLIQTFSLEFLKKEWGRWSFLARLSGLTKDQGKAPIDLRMSYINRAPARAARDKVLGWHCQRVIVAHGEWVRANGAAQLAKSFSWLGQPKKDE